MKCILCGSNKLRLLQTVKILDIIKCYETEKNINISKEFENLNLIKYYCCKNCDLSFFDPKINGSEEFYHKIQQSHKNYYKIRPEFLSIKHIVKETDDVLEIGAGDGRFLEVINPKNYLGLEYNEQAITKAREKGITLIKNSIEEFSSLEDNVQKYDVVCAFHVLEHVENPKEFIDCCLKVLRENGKLIIAVPCRNSLLTNNLNHTLNLPPHHISRWSIESFKNFGSLLNLKIASIIVNPLDSSMYRKYFILKWSKIINKLISPSSEVVDLSPSYKRIFKMINFLTRHIKLYKLGAKDNWYGDNMTVIIQNKMPNPND